MTTKNFVRCLSVSLMLVCTACGTWAVEEVDRGSSPSIALNPFTEEANISYFDGNYLAYAERDIAGVWQSEIVDIPEPYPIECMSGAISSLKIDFMGYPKIAYIAWTASDGYHLRYAEKIGATWDIVIVDSDGPAGSTGNSISLALTSTGEPRIAYSNSLNEFLKYAERTDGSWLIETVTNCNGSAGISLALTSTGEPRISFRFSSDQHYASLFGPLWTIERVIMLGDTGYDSSLALDPITEEPRIVSLHASILSGGMNLLYLVRDSGAWSMGTRLGEPDSFRGPSLAITSLGFPQFSFYSEDEEAFKFMWFNGMVWDSRIIDSTSTTVPEWSYINMISSLALTDADEARIAYAAPGGARHKVKYAEGSE